ncbi:MAG TPA: tetratricopeptide repeat protein, partial [Casimicrobiaceae bacterium]|nr:tetratricopeptide repeat protein [Casimicrobiaceae bacterium]
MSPSPSRNAPCPCGSGKRYKECHGALANPSAAEASGDPVAQAQAALRAGRHADALAALRRALVAEPENSELVRECARVAWLMGDAERAQADCRAALDRAPNDASAWNLLGEILRTADTAGAESAWRRALAVDPGNGEARFHLGNLYRERGDPRGARDEYERALGAAPGHPGILNNLGLALEASGERDRAESCYEQVLAADPRHADALGNLASSLFEREAYRQSALAYDRLFAIRRDVPASVWVRRGMAQERTGELASAEASFSEAARLAPDDARVHKNLGTVRFELQHYADAETAWLRVLELNPDSRYALSMLAYTRQHRCDWRGLPELHARINRLLEADDADAQDGVTPFNILAMPTSPVAQLRAAERWARSIPISPRLARPSLDATGTGRLRVGFVS